jgi:hypothetical protein
VARLAAGVGAMGLSRRTPQCAPCVVLTCSLPTSKAVLVRDLSVSVASLTWRVCKRKDAMECVKYDRTWIILIFPSPTALKHELNQINS